MKTYDQECEKFTTEQLKASLIELYKRRDKEGADAYVLTFDVLEDRMGYQAFDDWCATWYVRLWPV